MAYLMVQVVKRPLAVLRGAEKAGSPPRVDMQRRAESLRLEPVARRALCPLRAGLPRRAEPARQLFRCVNSILCGSECVDTLVDSSNCGRLRDPMRGGANLRERGLRFALRLGWKDCLRQRVCRYDQ